MPPKKKSVNTNVPDRRGNYTPRQIADNPALRDPQQQPSPLPHAPTSLRNTQQAMANDLITRLTQGLSPPTVRTGNEIVTESEKEIERTSQEKNDSAENRFDPDLIAPSKSDAQPSQPHSQPAVHDNRHLPPLLQRFLQMGSKQAFASIIPDLNRLDPTLMDDDAQRERYLQGLDAQMLTLNEFLEVDKIKDKKLKDKIKSLNETPFETETVGDVAANLSSYIKWLITKFDNPGAEDITDHPWVASINEAQKDYFLEESRGPSFQKELDQIKIQKFTRLKDPYNPNLIELRPKPDSFSEKDVLEIFQTEGEPPLEKVNLYDAIVRDDPFIEFLPSTINFLLKKLSKHKEPIFSSGRPNYTPAKERVQIKHYINEILQSIRSIPSSELVKLSQIDKVMSSYPLVNRLIEAYAGLNIGEFVFYHPTEAWTKWAKARNDYLASLPDDAPENPMFPDDITNQQAEALDIAQLIDHASELGTELQNYIGGDKKDTITHSTFVSHDDTGLFAKDYFSAPNIDLSRIVNFLDHYQQGRFGYESNLETPYSYTAALDLFNDFFEPEQALENSTEDAFVNSSQSTSQRVNPTQSHSQNQFIGSERLLPPSSGISFVNNEKTPSSDQQITSSQNVYTNPSAASQQSQHAPLLSPVPASQMSDRTFNEMRERLNQKGFELTRLHPFSQDAIDKVDSINSDDRARYLNEIYRLEQLEQTLFEISGELTGVGTTETDAAIAGIRQVFHDRNEQIRILANTVQDYNKKEALRRNQIVQRTDQMVGTTPPSPSPLGDESQVISQIIDDLDAIVPQNSMRTPEDIADIELLKAERDSFADQIQTQEEALRDLRQWITEHAADRASLEGERAVLQQQNETLQRQLNDATNEIRIVRQQNQAIIDEGNREIQRIQARLAEIQNSGENRNNEEIEALRAQYQQTLAALEYYQGEDYRTVVANEAVAQIQANLEQLDNDYRQLTARGRELFAQGQREFNALYDTYLNAMVLGIATHNATLDMANTHNNGLNDLHTKTGQINERLSQLTENFARLQAAVGSYRNRTPEQLADKNREITDLTRRNNALFETNRDLNNRLESATLEVGELEDTNVGLRNELYEATTTINRLTNEKERLNDQIGAQAARVAELEEVIGNQNDELARNNETIYELSSRFNDVPIQDVNPEDIQFEKINVDGLEVDVPRGLPNTYQQLFGQAAKLIDVYRKDIGDLAKMLDTYEKSVPELNMELEKRNQEVEKRDQQIESLNQQLQDERDLSRQLSTAAEDLQTQYDVTVYQLTQKLEELKDFVRTQHNNNQTLGDENSRLETENIQMRSLLDDKNEIIRNLTNQIQTFNNMTAEDQTNLVNKLRDIYIQELRERSLSGVKIDEFRARKAVERESQKARHEQEIERIKLKRGYQLEDDFARRTYQAQELMFNKKHTQERLNQQHQHTIDRLNLETTHRMQNRNHAVVSDLWKRGQIGNMTMKARALKNHQTADLIGRLVGVGDPVARALGASMFSKYIKDLTTLSDNELMATDYEEIIKMHDDGAIDRIITALATPQHTVDDALSKRISDLEHTTRSFINMMAQRTAHVGTAQTYHPPRRVFVGRDGVPRQGNRRARRGRTPRKTPKRRASGKFVSARKIKK